MQRAAPMMELAYVFYCAVEAGLKGRLGMDAPMELPFL
jgi:hypothetical protein